MKKGITWTPRPEVERLLFDYGTGWAPASHQLARAVGARSVVPGSVMALRPQGLMPQRLLFLANPWSGRVAVSVGGEALEPIALAAAEQGVRHVELPPVPEGAEIEIRNASEAPPRKKGATVWLLGAECGDRLVGHERVPAISNTVRVLHGQWGTFLGHRFDGISSAIDVRGAWAPDDVAVFERILRPGMTVLDIGANIGHHSVVFSRLVGPEGQVHAFEPELANYRLLNANLALNGCPNCLAHRVALGESAGTAEIRLEARNLARNAGGVFIAPSDAAEVGEGVVALGQAPLCRLDDLVGLRDLAGPVFLKMDIQGSEHAALTGAAGFLARHRPTVFAEVSRHFLGIHGRTYRDLYAMMFAQGYVAHHTTLPAGRSYRALMDDPMRDWDAVFVHGAAREAWPQVADALGTEAVGELDGLDAFFDRPFPAPEDRAD